MPRMTICKVVENGRLQSKQGNEKKTKDPAASIVDGGRLADRAFDPAASMYMYCQMMRTYIFIHIYIMCICVHMQYIIHHPIHTYVYA